MGNRVECPVCGARNSRNMMEREGCWSCASAAAQSEEDAAFAAFMRADEEARWRALWTHAGKPEAY